MRKATVQTVRQRYAFQCGYCGITEEENGSALTIDHYQPTSRGGRNNLANLVYSCHACNEYKGDHWNDDAGKRLLNPLHHDLSLHLKEAEDGRLVALTDQGAIHIETLNLNRPQLIRHRLKQRNVAGSLRRIEERLSELDALRSDVASLRREIRKLGSRL